METKPAFGRPAETLGSDSNFGLFCRVVFFCLVMAGILGMIHLVKVLFAVEGWASSEILVAFFAVILPMAVSLVLVERPRGDDWIMLRLGLATFCRTGLPIFCVAVITLLSKHRFQPAAAGFLLLFYILGILVVVWISVNRLRRNSQ